MRIDSIEQALRDSGKMGARGVQASGYLVGCALARDLLDSGTSVLAECVNPLELSRKWWRDIAASTNTRLVEVELCCSDTSEHRYRVERRSVDIAGLILPTWQDVQEREYKNCSEADLRIDTNAMTANEAAELIADTTTPHGQDQ